jgi:hypothetical protein
VHFTAMMPVLALLCFALFTPVGCSTHGSNLPETLVPTVRKISQAQAIESAVADARTRNIDPAQYEIAVREAGRDYLVVFQFRSETHIVFGGFGFLVDGEDGTVRRVERYQ